MLRAATLQAKHLPVGRARPFMQCVCVCVCVADVHEAPIKPLGCLVTVEAHAVMLVTPLIQRHMLLATACAVFIVCAVLWHEI
jgi:hypothetical protein